MDVVFAYFNQTGNFLNIHPLFCHRKSCLFCFFSSPLSIPSLYIFSISWHISSTPFCVSFNSCTLFPTIHLHIYSSGSNQQFLLQQIHFLLSHQCIYFSILLLRGNVGLHKIVFSKRYTKNARVAHCFLTLIFSLNSSCVEV